MDIETLADFLCEDLEPQIVAARLSGEFEMELILECDDWQATNRRQKFALRCTRVKESNICVGAVGSVSVHADHFVLHRHTGPQGAVYFSSKPDSVAEVFFVAHDVLSKCFAGWIDPADLLNGTPSELNSHLQGNYGLLASGPLWAMNALAERLRSLLKVNVVETVELRQHWKALILDSSWMICEAVHVAEIDG